MSLSELTRLCLNFLPSNLRTTIISAVIVGQIMQALTKIFEPALKLVAGQVNFSNLNSVTWFGLGCLIVFPLSFVSRLHAESKRDTMQRHLDLISLAITQADPPFSKAEKRSLQRELVLQLIQNLKIAGERKQVQTVLDEIEEAKSLSSPKMTSREEGA